VHSHVIQHYLLFLTIEGKQPWSSVFFFNIISRSLNPENRVAIYDTARSENRWDFQTYRIMGVSKLAPEEAELTTKSGAACMKTGKINRFRLLERILWAVYDRCTTEPRGIFKYVISSYDKYVCRRVWLFSYIFHWEQLFCSSIDAHHIWLIQPCNRAMQFKINSSHSLPRRKLLLFDATNFSHRRSTTRNRIMKVSATSLNRYCCRNLLRDI